MIARWWLPLLCCPMVVLAGEAKVEAGAKPQPQPKAKTEASPLQQLLDEQQKWTFEPPVGRIDVFYDIEEERVLLLQASSTGGAAVQGTTGTNATPADKERDKTLDWAKHELARVDAFSLARKWDDAMKVCDNAIKILVRFTDDAEFAQMAERFKRSHAQAEDAKIYEEAQAKFDALGLKVEGILWSPTSSMAIINGESRALKLNDRVKDCVIINIDTNRVDFLFHYNRRRFEFQRYVGEDVKAGDAKTSGRNR